MLANVAKAARIKPTEPGPTITTTRLAVADGGTKAATELGRCQSKRGPQAAPCNATCGQKPCPTGRSAPSCAKANSPNWAVKSITLMVGWAELMAKRETW